MELFAVLSEKKLAVLRVKKRHQVTLPREIFKRLLLQEDDFLVFIEKDGEIVLRKL